jgi:putative membrane protein
MLIRLLIRLVALALIIGLAAEIVPGMHVHGGFWTLVWLAILFSVVNLVVGTLARVLTLPLIVITLGLFLIIINAAMLALTAGLSSHLDIDNFGSAVLGGLVISFFSWILELLVPLGRRGTAAMTRSRGEDHRDAHR